MAYIATSPFLFIDTFGLRPDQYGLLAAFNVTGFLAGNLTSGRFTMRVGVERMVLLGVSLSLAGGLTMVATALLGGVGVLAVIFPMILFLTGMGLVFPNAMAGALGPFPRAAGAASALLGFFQMTAAAASSVVAGLLAHTTQLPMALSITAVSAAAFLAFITLSWPHRNVKAEDREPRRDARPR
jgi:DHA1 family bicyclomycin/chloramphenicol resistance-like MFS transporter